ncbi:MAG: hypothetical protein MK212_10985 [Saprospiraceae bacterium]|nr:hypothetical protein [Saprospiraceae bacterium]
MFNQEQTDTSNLALNPEKIINIIAKLEKRIEDRFPQSSLQKTCRDFLEIANQSQGNIQYIAKPNLLMRIFAAVVILIGLIGLIYSISLINFEMNSLNVIDAATLMEAITNDLILLGAAIFFLITMELRAKRGRALKILDQLRGLAHVVDMHQLTKDPIMVGVIKLKTYNSPERTLSKFQLQRYLDYCSEMLAMIGKVSALYAQSLPDDVIVGAVNEIETLTSGLSRKIWQKIIILSDIDDTPRLELEG